MNRVVRVVWIAVLATLALGSAAPRVRADVAPNSLSEAEKRSGWRLLFDGRAPDAFRGYKQPSLGGGWVVEDGAIVRRGTGAGDIVTKEEFGSFELQLEYMISPGGNSGLMFHVQETAAAPWMTGPEVQVIDNVAGHDPQKAGWLYGLYEPKPSAWVKKVLESGGLPPETWADATRPAGQWNHLYLRVAEGGGEVCVNGVSYFKFKKGDKDWDERVAKSKFAAFPEFGKATRGHICLQDHGDVVAFRSIKVRDLGGAALPSSDRTAAVKAVPAFPGATWEGWSPTGEDGKPVPPLRPLVVTHAGDDSGRRFVLDQSGMIHMLPKGSVEAKLFLDLRERTVHWKQGDEEGLLGLAFHPRFRENGEFFIRYCPRDKPRVRQVSRFKVRRDDPNRADPASEEVVYVNEQTFANHNGGSIAFGPDGFLYIGLGDGGGLNDLLGHGQNLSSVLGAILRIDVDRRDPGKAYAVPADNPFVGRSDARPEIYAYGFRNIWQMAFDPPTGRLWVADVGQDLLEEIDIVKKGGNYGWSVREGTKDFGRQAATTPTIDPVWEYDHQIGKSITGGCVSRGKEIPELAGAYVYADYVSGKLWALLLDDATGAVTNMTIPWSGLPIFGFGSDEAGEVYVNTASPTGQGVFRLVRDADAKPAQ
jgi:glucose/arabinose dehydrogenase